jgi:iron complex outermembrane receptor protein
VTDAWTPVDLRLVGEKRVGSTGMSPFAAIANLPDTRYPSSVVVNAAAARYYEPAPRRTYYLGLGIAFGGRSRR